MSGTRKPDSDCDPLGLATPGGFRRPDQVDPILVAASLELADEDIAEIERSF